MPPTPPTPSSAAGAAGAEKRKRGRPPAAAAAAAAASPSSASPSPAAPSSATRKKRAQDPSPPAAKRGRPSSAAAAGAGSAAVIGGDHPCQGTRKDGSACQRKAKGDCAHGRCVACCERLGEPCAAHEQLIKKRKEEEAMLAAPIKVGRSASGEELDHYGEGAIRVGPGDYKEPCIEVVGDTITLFSLRDFLRNKRWSKDILEQCLRRRRGKRGTVARGASGGSTNGNGSGVNEDAAARRREVGLALAQRRSRKCGAALQKLWAAAGIPGATTTTTMTGCA